MRYRRYAVLFILVVTSLVAAFTIQVSAANATSPYDGFYRTTPTVVLENEGSSPYYTPCAKIDYTTTWASAMLNAPQMTAEYATSFKEALLRGRLAVSQEYMRSYGNNYTSIMINWTEDSSLSLNWIPEGPAYPSRVEVNGGPSLHTVVLRNQNAQTSGSNCAPYAILGGSMGVISTVGRYGVPEKIWYEYKNLFVQSNHLNMPSGYGGESIRSQQPSARYVALGDSFSSGEGNPTFDPGTDSTINKCHRSSQAYPRLLQDSQGLSPMSFVACSGATIDDVLGNSESDDPIGKWGESKQIDALTDDTEVVTITIGGNDVGFKTFATNCALATCAVNSQPYNNIMDEIDINFQDKLEGLYRTILAESGDAEVYVVGYPLLVGDSSSGDCQTFEIVSDLGARAVTNALNSRVSAAVDAVRNDPNNVSYMGRLTYVPANSDNSTSPFDGKYICSAPPYFNGIDILHQEYSFHPNSAGHLAYKMIMEAALN